ncbi:Nramp family divalent metal transporter [Sunxiuqinia indica]|uniref:Nramp family divalent metal transporter n=1 Tax=Sunxiuqinia indica TaxID=2692584 RepID=UPI00135871C1|nr:Nramp family divalent metal transporter [Sunxiuqinia indica]
MQKQWWKAIGPGLIWAAAAIGVSHLVQSTRAGANYGFQLIIVVLLANLFKYPFFQFGPRYAIASGESLIAGYRRMGKWVVYLFLILTIATMFTILAAVTSVTVGIIGSVLPFSLSYLQFTIILLLICALIILIGHYKTLDRLIKFVIIVLSLSTITALVASFTTTGTMVVREDVPFVWNTTNISFLVALVGWMPSAIDISVWNSLWTIAKIKESGYKPSLKESMLDFNIGYFTTVFFALAFLGLGAMVMYNSGEIFATGGVAFSKQLLSLYTKTIGGWSYWIIAVAAIATMFSTTLTVLDAYPRVLNSVVDTLKPENTKSTSYTKLNLLWMIVLAAGAVLLIFQFSDKMKLLVDIATTLSFITAPVIGFLNLKAITAKHVPDKYKPGRFLMVLSWVGLIVLTTFALYFLWIRFV